MPQEVRLPILRIKVGRYLFLLISILLWLVLRPFLEDAIRLSFLMDIFLTLILVSGVYAISQSRTVYIIGLIFVVLTLALIWLNFALELYALDIAGKALAILFLVFVETIILIHLFRSKEISADIIRGAVCAYFLIGFIWASGYALLELVHPGSFQIGQAGQPEASHFGYYSFVTLTTLGYGDITPVTNQARYLSVLEAALGQLYLAVLIARLVGMHISQKQERRSQG